MLIQQHITAQLDELLGEYETLRPRSKYDDLSDLPEAELTRFITRARAAVRRVAGDSSVYAEQCEDVLRRDAFPGHHARRLAGVIDSLRADVAAGYLESQRELIHGELFADFLEMARHLLDEGYKDPAAIIAGSSLEAHLRRLCEKIGVAVNLSERGKRVPKKADRLNADLAKEKAYSKLDQKNVTAWLDLRNKAAHGHYDGYSSSQVELLISAVQDFITRNPA